METCNDGGHLNVEIFLNNTYASTRKEFSYIVNYFTPFAADVTTLSVNKLSLSSVPYIRRSSEWPYFKMCY
jgi:hypothetical protein